MRQTLPFNQNLNQENQRILNEFLQNSEDSIQKRRIELQNKYTFDFEEETPINHPRPTFNFTQQNPSQIHQYYHTRDQVIDRKPLAVNLNKVAIGKDFKQQQEVLETRQSFVTQASTFVGGDRLSTFQNFFDLPSDRMKLSLFNITDRSEDNDQSLIVGSHLVTESGDLKESQITETLNNSSMIEEHCNVELNQKQNLSIMNLSKDLIVQQFRQKVAMSQQVTPLKNPILPQIMREPLKLEPFNLILDQAFSRKFEDKVTIKENEKKQIQTPQKQQNTQVNQSISQQYKVKTLVNSSKNKTPQVVRKVRSNERLNFSQINSTTAQNSPQRKLLLQTKEQYNAFYSPKNINKSSTQLNTSTALKSKLSTSNTAKNIISEDKKKKLTNKKALQQLMSSNDTRNLKQIRQANSNQSFTLKKFNQSSSSIQMVKSFQPQLNKLSPPIDLKATHNKHSTTNFEIKSPTFIPSQTRTPQEEDQSNHSDYFQFGNSTDGCLLPSYNEEGKSPCTELISNIRQSQRKYRKQSDQEPESQKLIPSTTQTNPIILNSTLKVKLSGEKNLSAMKSRNIIKENLTTSAHLPLQRHVTQKEQINQKLTSQQDVSQAIIKGQISLNRSLTKKSFENL